MIKTLSKKISQDVKWNIFSSLILIPLILSVAAQIKIYLPFTPVPITGQSFGVLLIALTFNRLSAPIGVVTYLTYAALGLPVLASSSLIGVTSGYLIGFLIAALVLPFLKQKLRTPRFLSTMNLVLLGHVIILTSGVFVLSFLIPSSQSAFALGFYPFIPGMIIKSVCLAFSLSAWNSLTNSK